MYFIDIFIKTGKLKEAMKEKGLTLTIFLVIQLKISSVIDFLLIQIN